MININPQLRKSFYSAVTEARQNGRDYVDSATLTLGIMQEATSHAAQILLAHGLKPQAFRSIAKSYPGANQLFEFSIPEITAKMGQPLNECLTKAVQLATDNDLEAVTPETVMIALLDGDSNLTSILVKASVPREQIESIKRELEVVVFGVDSQSVDANGKSTCAGGSCKKKPVKSVLKQFTTDLTAMAREGKLPPVIGRLPEITKAIRILGRKTKNNPVLVGEAGVGKTAVAEGIAQRIVAGNVPKRLKNKRLLQLDMNTMVAGCSLRGEFEERMAALVKEVKAAGDVILFIDELHTIVGAGASQGSTDASNTLKPALARGEISTIGATTLSEYRKYIENKDAALTRRFRAVLLDPPSIAETIQILQGLRESYEKHHKVKLSDEALNKAAELSDRYITDRFQPDKSIDLIDEAASKLAMETDGQDESLPEPIVTDEHIALVVSEWTGVPVTSITADEKQRLLTMETEIHKRVIGQKAGVSTLARAIRRGRVGMKDPKRPIGGFLFLGPTGVGKTEVARALQQFLNGREQDMIRLDMSEYMERHAVATLIGAPPGYIGYEEGGKLTEAVRRRPYAVVLFDEIEKAHPDVFNVLLQIFEDGRLTDRQGRTTDFCNTILIMTSNIGAHKLQAAYDPASEAKVYESVLADVKHVFNPEFINRLDEVVCFNQLTQDEVNEIFHLMAAKVKERMPQNTTLVLEDSAVEFVCSKGFDPTYGARPMRRAVCRHLEDPLTDVLLAGTQGGDQLIARAVNGQIEVERVPYIPVPVLVDAEREPGVDD